MSEKQKEDMHVTWPDLNKISCKDCEYRNKTIVEINGKNIPFGTIKTTCDMYPGYPYDEKPSKILFQNEPCELYEKED